MRWKRLKIAMLENAVTKKNEAVKVEGLLGGVQFEVRR